MNKKYQFWHYKYEHNVKEEFNLQVKVAEFVGESRKGWQDAIENAVAEASRTMRNITGVEVYNGTADCSDNKIVEYKANIKIAYVD